MRRIGLAAGHPAAGELSDGGKIKKRTIANLSSWPTDIIEGLRTRSRGEGRGGRSETSWCAARCRRACGAVLGTLRDIGLDRLLEPAGNAAATS